MIAKRSQVENTPGHVDLSLSNEACWRRLAPREHPITKLAHIKVTTATSDAPASDDTCASCCSEEAEKPFDAYLEHFHEPVLVLHEDGRIAATNALAREHLGMDTLAPENNMLGDALGCTHAALPGGCGQQEACRPCEMRAAFESTFRAGEPLYELSVHVETPATRKQLVISTQMMGALVAVVIQRASVEDFSLR